MEDLREARCSVLVLILLVFLRCLAFWARSLAFSDRVKKFASFPTVLLSKMDDGASACSLSLLRSIFLREFDRIILLKVFFLEVDQ